MATRPRGPPERFPPGGPDAARAQMVPPTRVDREKTCPMLLRMFYSVDSYLQPKDFDFARNIYPKNELQVYTWRDATLRELTELLKEMLPQGKRYVSELHFAVACPDDHGRTTQQPIGVVHAVHRSEPDMHQLHQLRVRPGDVICVAVVPEPIPAPVPPPMRAPPPHFDEPPMGPRGGPSGPWRGDQLPPPPPMAFDGPRRDMRERDRDPRDRDRDPRDFGGGGGVSGDVRPPPPDARDQRGRMPDRPPAVRDYRDRDRDRDRERDRDGGGAGGGFDERRGPGGPGGPRGGGPDDFDDRPRGRR